jgi:hypothetical protein
MMSDKASCADVPVQESEHRFPLYGPGFSLVVDRQ